MAPTLPTAVMPKGVEHASASVGAINAMLPTAVMPKGVEHDRHQRGEMDQLLPTAVMPKGVEHTGDGAPPQWKHSSRQP